MTTRLVVATGNHHKLIEIRQIIKSALPLAEVQAMTSMKDFTDVEPVEDGVTFEENALIKARAACKATGIPALADDSGLAVEILGGSPGIFSARWCGHHGDDTRNRELLLEQLSDVPDRHRQAAFVCAVALVFPDGTETVQRGQVVGTLIRESRGEGGFGYDPIFVPDGYSMTAAELGVEEKNAISHRGKALRAIAPGLEPLLR